MKVFLKLYQSYDTSYFLSICHLKILNISRLFLTKYISFFYFFTKHYITMQLAVFTKLTFEILIFIILCDFWYIMILLFHIINIAFPFLLFQIISLSNYFTFELIWFFNNIWFNMTKFRLSCLIFNTVSYCS